MKTLIAFLFALTVPYFAHAHCGLDHHKAKMAKIGQGQMQIQVSGMVCADCVKKLSKEVAKIKHSKQVKIEVTENLVTVDYGKTKLSAKNLKTLKAQIAKAVKKANFKLEQSS